MEYTALKLLLNKIRTEFCDLDLECLLRVTKGHPWSRFETEKNLRVSV